MFFRVTKLTILLMIVGVWTGAYGGGLGDEQRPQASCSQPIQSIEMSMDSDPEGHVWNVLPVKRGEPLCQPAVDYLQYYFQKLPSIQVALEEWTPGRWRVFWKQKNPWRGHLWVDNSGAQRRHFLGGGSLQQDHFLLLNDVLIGQLSGDVFKKGAHRHDNMHQGSLTYSIPWHWWRTEIQIQTMQNKSIVPQEEGEQAVFWGKTYQQSLRWMYMLLFDSHQQIEWRLSVQKRLADRWVNNAPVWSGHGRSSALVLGLHYQEKPALAGQRGGACSVHFLQKQIPFMECEIFYQYPWRWRGTVGSWRTEVYAQYAQGLLSDNDRFILTGSGRVHGMGAAGSLSSESGWILSEKLDLQPSFLPFSVYSGVALGRAMGLSAQQWSSPYVAGMECGVRAGYQALSSTVSIEHLFKAPQGIVVSPFVLLWRIQLSF